MRNKDTFAATSAVNQGPHELLTVPTAAARLSLAEKTLWSWIAARRITVVRLGRAVGYLAQKSKGLCSRELHQLAGRPRTPTAPKAHPARSRYEKGKSHEQNITG